MRYNSYRAYLKTKFGGRVLKVPLKSGFSCPNIDGKKGRQGCIFCDNRAFSPAAESRVEPYQDFCRRVAQRSDRYRFFLPYLQPYTNTYAPVSNLREVYEPLISHERSIGIAVGTRPDELSQDVCDYIKEIADRKYILVEIGLQSFSDDVLKKCSRRHTAEDFESAVHRLSDTGAEICVHLMAGLPGQTRDLIRYTAEKVSGLPVHGIKLHQLMVIRGTPAEKIYNAGGIEPLSIEEYADIAGDVLERIRRDQVVHRLIADSKEEYGLIAPDWSASKLDSLNKINMSLKSRGVVQGSHSPYQ